MTMHTYYPPRQASPGPEEATPADDPHNIAHGYNLADLDRYARIALSRCYARAGDTIDRYQAAWTAIAEALCADTAPAPYDLIATGAEAVNRYIETEMRHHGIRHGAQRPRFEAYWTAPVADPVADRIVDAVALWQIVPMLTYAEYQALAALAATGDRTRAAAILHISEATLNARLSAARRRFLSWWHEGETPSRLWRRDRRWAARDGTWRGRPTLTDEQTRQIQDRYASGDTQAAIATDYGVSEATIQRIASGRTNR